MRRVLRRKSSAGMRRRILSILLAAALCLSLATPAMAAEKAKTIRLIQTEGSVTVTNSSGESQQVMEDMRLYSGYHVATASDLNLVIYGAEGDDSYSSVRLMDAHLKKLTVMGGNVIIYAYEHSMNDIATVELQGDALLRFMQPGCTHIGTIKYDAAPKVIIDSGSVYLDMSDLPLIDKSGAY